MSNETRLWHRRHHRWEAFERIELVVVPRYKTSGLSGDEWRTGVHMRCWFKGEVVVEEFFSSMDWALRLINGKLAEATCPIPDRVIELEKTKCDQPGCSADAIARFRLKRLTSDCGEYLHPDEGSFAEHYRQFCRQHLRRGDCSREDSDDNYEPLDGIGPDDSSNVIESPSAVVFVDPTGKAGG